MTPLIDPHSQAKTLVIMRHAEAGMPWGTDDFDRPLTERGQEQARGAGRWLLEHATPEMMLCSSALRTRQTCTWLCDELGDRAPTASLDDRLYNCAPQEILRAINRTPDTVHSLVLIAHYPGVQEATERLASRDSDYEAVMDASSGFAPASMAVFTTEKPWQELDGADALLRSFVTS